MPQSPNTSASPADTGTVTTVAAIDIGANAIRAVIAQVAPNGDIEVLDRLQRAVRMGQDTFRQGRLSRSAIRAAVDILRDYRRKLDFYNVAHIRVVATSAVREAGNADTFVDRVAVATGLDVEVIDTSEESRLTVWALRHAAARALSRRRSRTLVVDVGGGSALLTVMKAGAVIASVSLPLGSIRLREYLSADEQSAPKAAEILRRQIDATFVNTMTSERLMPIHQVVALGGGARFAAEQLAGAPSATDLTAIPLEPFESLVRQCEALTIDEIARRYPMPYVEAEKLTPSLLVYRGVLHATHAEQMLVSGASMTEGLLLDLARTVTGEEDPALIDGVIRSATAIAEKYRADLRHALHVTDDALRLFDALRDEHRLGPRHRLLLQVAGILHDIGTFVNSRAHHKHSYYLIANSELFGLTREETLLVALIARYHRRSAPKPTHREYMQLPREQRMIVSKLAAILRVADALDRAHIQRLHDLQIRREGRQIILVADGAGEPTLERRILANKGELFTDIYGLTVEIAQR